MMAALPKFVLLWSDVVVLLLAAVLVVYAWRVRANANRRRDWLKVFRQPAALSSAVVLGAFLMVAVTDSVHFRRALPAAGGAGSTQAYSTQVESLLDVALAPLARSREVTYSAPLAARAFAKASQGAERGFPRLLHGGAHLGDDTTERLPDLAWRALTGLAAGLVITAALALAAFAAVLGRTALAAAWRHDTEVPWRAAFWTVLGLGTLVGCVVALAPYYHLLGTDRTGNDVLFQALKSVRTAFVIGTLSTIATLPLAVGLGIVAGYFRGWVDDAVQYVYTVLSSIPNVLLIAACVLMMQVFIDTHPDLFETGAERADVRLFLLCVILGLTGWAGLCRLLRAETLKLRELDYVQAATAFGVGPWRIMGRHVFPNVVHLVIITTVLDFSALVLYEAVLSYVGVGVDPTMNSFGGMINLARSEMSRDPVVWWSFAAAFGFMVSLVLVANLFADGVRDAFDPRARVFRARRPAPPKEVA